MASYNVAGLARLCAHSHLPDFLPSRPLPDRHSLPHMGGSSQPTSAERRAGRSPSLMLCSCSCLPILFCLLWAAVSADLPPVDECAPEPCGDGLNVSYPFWIEERQHPWCGYPAFNISCEDKATTPFIKISGKKFVVEDIFYENQSFTLSDPELYSYEGCPVAQDNLSLDATQFKLSSHNRYLFYFLDCLERQLSNLIDCKTNGKFYSYVDINQSSSDLGGVAKQGSCESFVSWPYWDDGDGNQDYKTLQKKGFLLSWDGVVNCSVCKESDGRCRYNVSRERFSCVCSDQEQAISCTVRKAGLRLRKAAILGLSAGVGCLLFVVIAFCFVYRLRSRVAKSQRLDVSEASDSETRAISWEVNDVSDLPLLDFECVRAATSNFSVQNKLGEGGFGPVYKGRLNACGREIAVKRLSKLSKQGHREFSNEINLIARLQHKNLVRLLGSCAHKNEKLLIYEYMPNKSLDHFIFDPKRSAELRWRKRFEIIQGIASGLLYLHHYSRMRVIHRDLKTSNVLLDRDLNPKISDFGLARIFGADQIEANTGKVVGTLGYISPEYASQGLFSEKSDVFSFGVILLEIITGKRSTSFRPQENFQTLIGYVWQMWEEDRALEIQDPSMGLSSSAHQASEIMKCIHLALLCVQIDAAERPAMSAVVSFLSNMDSCPLPKPSSPAFAIGADYTMPAASKASVNGLTYSSIGVR